MDTTTNHDLGDLFDQLGLPSAPHEVNGFIRAHRPLPSDLALAQAPIWTPSQARFLAEQWRQDDGDWAILVDVLDARMRTHPHPASLPQREDTAR